MKKWLLLKNIPISKLECKTTAYFWPKWPKQTTIYTSFIIKRAKNHTLWDRTYLYNSYKGVSPEESLALRNIARKLKCMYNLRAGLDNVFKELSNYIDNTFNSTRCATGITKMAVDSTIQPPGCQRWLCQHISFLCVDSESMYLLTLWRLSVLRSVVRGISTLSAAQHSLLSTESTDVI